MSKRVLMIAGEASGDQHAAAVLSQLKKDLPELDAFGIGGPMLRAAGLRCLLPSESLSILGFWAIIKQYAVIRHAFKTIQQAIIKQKPDLLILVDFSGFNLRIAKFAKRHGCKILYFISPQVWAWRQYRVKTIRKVVDHMAVIFPFEKAFYQQHNVPVTYVGNPAYNDCVQYLKDQTAKHSSATTVGLFPGSRKSEIVSLLPTMVSAARQLQEKNPGIQFILPIAATLDEAFIRAHLPKDLNIECRHGVIYDSIQACDAIISASGTVTLQIALLSVPQVVIYKINPLTAFLIRRLTTLRYAAMCNLIAGREIARELLQADLTVENVSAEVQRLLHDKAYRDDKIDSMASLQAAFDQKDCAKNTAQLAQQMW